MLFEKDGYKTFWGEKWWWFLVAKFVTSQALMVGNIFIGGI